MSAALQRLATIGLVFGFGVLLGAIWQPKWPTAVSSFEECLLDEMRGQSKDLTAVAAKLCRSRFPVVPDLSEAPDEIDTASQPKIIDDRLEPTSE